MGVKQGIVTTDGVSMDLPKTAKEAKNGVDRDESGVPIHVCGLRSYRDCPCTKCAGGCKACFASMI